MSPALKNKMMEEYFRTTSLSSLSTEINITDYRLHLLTEKLKQIETRNAEKEIPNILRLNTKKDQVKPVWKAEEGKLGFSGELCNFPNFVYLRFLTWILLFLVVQKIDKEEKTEEVTEEKNEPEEAKIQAKDTIPAPKPEMGTISQILEGVDISQIKEEIQEGLTKKVDHPDQLNADEMNPEINNDKSVSF